MSTPAERPNAVLDLVACVQAVRRRLERARHPVVGPLGVRAYSYPHQVANVWRMLTAPRLRFLLADEVGLGKTVQAIMVINALRLQRRDESAGDRDLRALIVVPDALTAQWRDELFARCHEAPGMPPKAPDAEDSDEGLIETPQTDVESERRTVLAWPRRLRDESYIAPDRFDLLIVDEVHNLDARIRDRVWTMGPRFGALLLLSATPMMHEPARALEVFGLLEPERFAAALDARLAAEPERFEAARSRPPRLWPANLARAVAVDLWTMEQSIAFPALARDWSRLAAPPAEDLSLVAEAHCMGRRIIRTRRRELAGLLPARTFRRIEVAPLESEITRVDLIRAYARIAEEEGLRLDTELLLRRALAGGDSFRAAARTLIREGRDRAEHVQRALDAAAPARGDSRLDALTDLLASRWATDPELQVVVAVQDAAGVDYVSRAIAARLPRIGPPDSAQALQVVTVRAAHELASGELATHGVAGAQLDSFQAGAQLLVAADVAQVGLNLQRARVVVFYCFPWVPDVLEQWIGRIDRLGAARDDDTGDFAPVEVVALTFAGAVDGHVAAEFERRGIFTSVEQDAAARATAHERALQLACPWRANASPPAGTGAASGAPAAPAPTWRVEALPPGVPPGAPAGEGCWHPPCCACGAVLACQACTRRSPNVAVDGRRCARCFLNGVNAPPPPSDAPELLDERPLQAASRYTAEWVRSVRADEAKATPLPPALFATERASARRLRELALEGWIDLLRRMDEYRILTSREDGPAGARRWFKTFWYRFDEWGHRQRRLLSRVILGGGLPDPGIDPRVRNEVPFITRRGELDYPPRSSITIDYDGDRRIKPLTFLDHGAVLHEELVTCWERFARSGQLATEFEASYPQDHPIYSVLTPGEYALTVAWVDPAAHVLPAVDEAAAAALDRTDLDFLLQVRRALYAAHEADARWIRALLPAQLMAHLERLRRDGAEQLPEEHAWLLLNPYVGPRERAHDLPGAWLVTPRHPATLQAARARAREALRARLATVWREPRERLADATKARAYVLSADHAVEQGLTARRVAAERGRLHAIPEGARHRSIVAAQVRDAERAQQLVTFAAQQRLRWLGELEARAAHAGPHHFVTALVRLLPGAAPVQAEKGAPHGP